MEFLSWLHLDTMAIPKNWNNSILFITLASFIVWGVWRVFYNRLMIITEKTQIQWDNLLLHALKTPISVVIWCWPATISLGLFLEEHVVSKLDWLETSKRLMIVAIFIWTLLRLTNNIEHYILVHKKKGADLPQYRYCD